MQYSIAARLLWDQLGETDKITWIIDQCTGSDITKRKLSRDRCHTNIYSMSIHQSTWQINQVKNIIDKYRSVFNLWQRKSRQSSSFLVPQALKHKTFKSILEFKK